MTERYVELSNFRGPLDLLLHLVRERELEITEVALAQVCDQYLAYVARLDALDIDDQSEFLVVAATLMLIKSRQLLPGEEVDLAEELDTEDPLILQLLEYRRYKTLSIELARRAQDRALRATRGTHEVPPPEDPELEDVSVWDLAGTFARLFEEIGLQRRFDTLRQDERPLREFMHVILERLAERDAWSFRELVLDGSAESLIGSFLAVLELAKSGQITVEQDSAGAEILIRLREDRDEHSLATLLGTGTDAESPGDAAEHEGRAASDGRDATEEDHAGAAEAQGATDTSDGAGATSEGVGDPRAPADPSRCTPGPGGAGLATGAPPSLEAGG